MALGRVKALPGVVLLALAVYWGIAAGPEPMPVAGQAAPVEGNDPITHPALADAPRRTQTRAGIPGDPINLALVGSEKELVSAMLAAGWHPADPVTFRSCMRVTTHAMLHRSYADAPVSNLYVYKRKQDLAFEQLVGKGPSRRHHVRFWRSDKVDDQGRPLWLGAATYDSRVEVSHTTHFITHRIAPDVDSERDKVMGDLRAAGRLPSFRWVEPFQLEREGRNGGGDRYYTDGRLALGLLAPESP
jgi:hypothetical protein